jgi:hypothetical protein
MSAFYVVAYLSLSVPAVAAGLAVPALGLEPTFRIFSALVVVMALGLSAALARTSGKSVAQEELAVVLERPHELEPGKLRQRRAA